MAIKRTMAANLSSSPKNSKPISEYVDFAKARIEENGYKVTGELGRGTYGIVFKGCEYHDETECVAIKIARKNVDDELQTLRLINEKISVKRKLVIATMIDSVADFSWDIDIMMFELMDQTLWTYIRAVKMEPLLIKSYMFQLLLAAQFIHSIGIAHLDIKPNNLLINHAGLLKLADFGAAAKINEFVVGQKTTWQYRPMELINKDSFMVTSRIDMWSIGCVFYEMITQKILFNPRKEKLLLSNILDKFMIPYLLETNSTAIVNPDIIGIFGGVIVEQRIFMQKFLKLAPILRIRAGAALKDPYFTNLDKRYFL